MTKCSKMNSGDGCTYLRILKTIDLHTSDGRTVECICELYLNKAVIKKKKKNHLRVRHWRYGKNQIQFGKKRVN